MKIKLCLFLFSLMLLLLSADIVSAATISLSKTGVDTYRISGTDMNSVAGMSFIVSYDPATLSEPQITAGQLVSGAMFSANPKFTTSSIMFAVISSQNFNPSGTIATIKFKVKPGTSPQKPEIMNPDFSSLSASNIEAKIGQGTDTSGDGNVSTSLGEKTSDEKTSDDKSSGDDNISETTTADTGTAKQTGVLGTVTMPTDTPAAEQKAPSGQAESTGTINGEQQVSEPVTSYAEPQQQADSTQEEKKEARKEQFVSHLSMIERFRQYEGERTPAKLLALLKETGKGYSQDPPVLLSDGKATVKVSISLPPDTTTAPNVAISREGQMVSFRRGDEGTWIVELRPKKDVGQVTLTYFINDQVTEIPLTVAPKLESFRGKPFAKLTEEEFAQFIAGRTAAKEIQPHDLNKDQVLNYIDDFIFSANYLVQVPPVKTDKAPPVAKPAPEPPASKPQEKAKPAAAGSGKP